MSARHRVPTASSTSPIRCSTAAAYAAISVSSRALRVAIRVSVSWRIRAISAFDQSLMPARSSSAGGGGHRFPPSRPPGWHRSPRSRRPRRPRGRGHGRPRWSRGSRWPGHRQLGGFSRRRRCRRPGRPARRGFAGVGHAGSPDGIERLRRDLREPLLGGGVRIGWEAVPGSTTPASASGAATAEPNRSASSWERSELHGSRKGERLSGGRHRRVLPLWDGVARGLRAPYALGWALVQSLEVLRTAPTGTDLPGSGCSAGARRPGGKETVRAAIRPRRLPCAGGSREPPDRTRDHPAPAGTPAFDGRPGVPDALGRALRDLRISVTDRCNFRCTYCMPAEVFGRDFAFLPRSQVLDFEEVARLAAIFVRLGVHKLRITGGEPLVRRDLPALIELLAALRTPDGEPGPDPDHQWLGAPGAGAVHSRPRGSGGSP